MQPAAAPPTAATGPWSTVGAGGKVTTPTRPPVAAAAGPSTTSSLKPKTAASTPQPAKARVATPQPLPDTPPPPSTELLKWIRLSLQGFSANRAFFSRFLGTAVSRELRTVDDFVNLLFSFPLEADELTLEVISDTVYANSKTLDGKRFATDFVARRKADARAIRNGTAVPTAGGGGSRIPSMAEAVKSVPSVKAAPEQFKVVVKKAKKGR